MRWADFDYNGWGRTRTFGSWDGKRFASLDAFRAGTGLEKNGIVVQQGPGELFASGAGFPKDPKGMFIPPEKNDLRLSANASAIDRGVALPNINDGFAGKAPDLGAHEFGRDMPIYGPRPKGLKGILVAGRIVNPADAKPAPAVWPKAAAKNNDKMKADREAVKAAAARASPAFRQKIIAGVRAGKRTAIYIDFGGRPTRGRLVSANEDGLVVSGSVGEIAVPWDSVNPARFAGIAAKYAGDDASARIQIAALYAAASRTEAARRIVDEVSGLDEKWRPLAEAIRRLGE